MVYLVENNIKKWTEAVINHVWQVAKFNLMKAKSKILKSLNAELICVLLWNSPEYIITLAQQDNLLNPLCVNIVNCEPKIKEEHQRQRIIFGLCELMLMREKPAEVMPFLPKFFNLMINLVKKNCEVRLDDSCDENYETDSEED